MAVKTFNELKVWQKSHEFVLCIYKITKDFPSDERFALTQQIRRAVVSVASNIVEGFHRNSTKESLHFYNIAEASLEEVKYQLLIAKDLDYISTSTYEYALDLSKQVGRMLYYWVESQTTKKSN